MKRKISKTAKLDYDSPIPFEIEISGDIRRKHLNSNSMFSHFEGGPQELQKLISDNWDKGWLSDQKRGRSGNSEVWIVPLPPDKFYTGLVKINDASELTAEWSQQLHGQGFRKRVMAKAPQKSKADFARAVVLVSTAKPIAQFFVLTINAGILNEGQDPQTFKEPMSPQTLMYNRYEYGETHSPEEFDKILRKAFHYWKDKAFYAGPSSRPDPTNQPPGSKDELIQMANRLDQKGFKKEADFLDKIIQKMN